MRVLVKISDRQYELLQRVAKTKRGMENLSEYGELILNGTPLPEGQKPCDNAIDRSDAIGAFQMFRECDSNRTNAEWVDRIETVLGQLPPVTSPQKIGHWIFVDKAKGHARCSECDYGNVDLFDGRLHNYCEKCGAKMQESEDKE